MGKCSAHGSLVPPPCPYQGKITSVCSAPSTRVSLIAEEARRMTEVSTLQRTGSAYSSRRESSPERLALPGMGTLHHAAQCRSAFGNQRYLLDHEADGDFDLAAHGTTFGWRPKTEFRGCCPAFSRGTPCCPVAPTGYPAAFSSPLL